MMRDDLYGQNLRRSFKGKELIQRSTDSVVVDEVDNLLLDMALNSARLAIESPEHTAWIYEILFTHVLNGG